MEDEITDRKATNIDGSRNLKRPAIIVWQKLYSTSLLDGVVVDIVETAVRRIQCNFITWVGLVRASDSNFPTERLKTTHAEILKEDQE
jgi:hypothetical protein